MSSSQGTQTVAACCHINSLPTETLTSIFHYLDISDLISCCRACRSWRNIISYSESIWRSLCATLTDSYLLVESDRRKGFSWKETFHRNYGANGLKHLWREGVFSKVTCYQQLPAATFCHLDTDSWGQILQWELERP